MLIIFGSDRRNAILAAAEYGYDVVVKQLLDAGGDVEGLRIRMSASRTNDKRIIQLFQDAGAEITTEESKDSDSPTAGRSGKVKGMATLVEEFEEITISPENLRKASLSVKFCDECGEAIPDGDVFYHCRICLDDDWDSCEKCVMSGYPCRERTHTMVKYQMKNGVIREVEK
jgi:hypothetical protein